MGKMVKVFSPFLCPPFTILLFYRFTYYHLPFYLLTLLPINITFAPKLFARKWGM